MPDAEPASPATAPPSVFLSYASEDRQAVRSLRDALTGFGIDVWYDENELGGGEAWEQKIRRQIRECDYFMPVVSAQTERRHEGYFRREWRLAVERTLDMADDHPFLLPVAIDGTDQASARVPEKFLSVQWLRAPEGRRTPALDSLCRRIATGSINTLDAAPRPRRTERRAAEAGAAVAAAAGAAAAGPASPIPSFPVETDGQKVRFWFEVLGWLLRSTWLHFQRLPRKLRILAYVFLCIAVVSRCDSSAPRHASRVTPEEVQKLKAIAQVYAGAKNRDDIARLGTQIAKEFADDDADSSADGGPLLAIPFAAPPNDAAAAQFANSAFAMAYGRLAISHHGQVALAPDPPDSAELAAAVARGKAAHATYILCGGVQSLGSRQVLKVSIANVAAGTEVWSQTYPVPGADATKIAGDVAAHVPPLETN